MVNGIPSGVQYRVSILNLLILGFHFLAVAAVSYASNKPHSQVMLEFIQAKIWGFFKIST